MFLCFFDFLGHPNWNLKYTIFEVKRHHKPCFQSMLRTERSSHRRFSVKKGVLRNFTKFTGKHLCQSVFFNKRETLAQVFSCEFCEISKNIVFTEHLQATASEKRQSPIGDWSLRPATLLKKDPRIGVFLRILQNV